MFSNKSKTKNKSKRPAPANASSASSQPQKAPEKPRAPAPEAQDARSASKNSSSLNPNLSFEGNLKFSGTVLIDCDFRGTVETDDTLVVGVAGTVHAEVTAGVVEVSGKVHGNIVASTSVKVFSGGEVHGNIETPTISMEEGVIFEGNCTRPGSTPPSPRSEPVAESHAESQATSSESARPAQSKPPTLDSSSLESARKKIIATATELAEAR